MKHQAIVKHKSYWAKKREQLQPGLEFFIEIRFDLDLGLKNLFQGHCTLFNPKQSVGKVRPRFGLRERTHSLDKRSALAFDIESWFKVT